MEDIHSQNGYSYVGNNPVMKMDATGETALALLGATGSLSKAFSNMTPSAREAVRGFITRVQNRAGSLIEKLKPVNRGRSSKDPGDLVEEIMQKIDMVDLVDTVVDEDLNIEDLLDNLSPEDIMSQIILMKLGKKSGIVPGRPGRGIKRVEINLKREVLRILLKL